MPTWHGDNIPAGPVFDISSICIHNVVSLVTSMMSPQGLGNEQEGLNDHEQFNLKRVNTNKSHILGENNR